MSWRGEARYALRLMRGVRSSVAVVVVGLAAWIAGGCGGDEGSARDRSVDGGVGGTSGSGGDDGGVSDGSWPDTSVAGAGGGAAASGAGGGANGGSAGGGRDARGGTGGDGRVSDGLVARYDFDEGSGATVKDVSGVGPAIDLTIQDTNAVTWIAGALRIDSSVVVSSTGSTTKIVDACTAADEITIDTWIKPANVTQAGPARVVSLSPTPDERNFTLGQDAGDWAVRLRTSTGTIQGAPYTFATEAVSTALEHVAFKFDATGFVSIFVDGVLAGALHRGGDFSTWATGYPLVVANEFTGDRPWLGELHLIAIYCRGLTEAEIGQNFAAGPG